MDMETNKQKTQVKFRICNMQRLTFMCRDLRVQRPLRVAISTCGDLCAEISTCSDLYAQRSLHAVISMCGDQPAHDWSLCAGTSTCRDLYLQGPLRAEISTRNDLYVQ